MCLRRGVRWWLKELGYWWIGWVEIDVPEAEMVTKLRPYWKDMSTKNFHASLAIDYC